MAKTKTKPAKVIDAEVETKAITVVNAGGAIEQSRTLGLIEMAIAKGIEPDKLEKLMDLHERNERNKAIIAFNKSMNSAQMEMTPVVATKTNEAAGGAKYPAMEAIQNMARPVYTKHGFSIVFGEADAKTPGEFRTTCEVRHAGGHTETYYLDLEKDDKGPKGNANKTAVHGRLSTDTYARSRLLIKVWNISIDKDGSDTDGNTDAATIDDKQTAEINTLIEAIRDNGDFNFDGFKSWIGIKSLDDLRADQFDKAMKELQSKLEANKKLKATIDSWAKWFAEPREVDEVNKEFTQKYYKLPEGANKAKLMEAVSKIADAAGFAWNKDFNRFVAKP